MTSLAAVMPILLAVPVGYFADRLPRTKMTGIGAALWGVFSILTAFAGSLTFLGIFRFGSGLGKTMDPAHQALLSDYYPPERRAGVFAVHRFGNEIGLMVAPVVAGVLASLFFWQMPFLIFGVPSLILSVLAFVLLREPVRGAQERRSLGAEDGADYVPEPPPGWTESWRITRWCAHAAAGVHVAAVPRRIQSRNPRSAVGLLRRGLPLVRCDPRNLARRSTAPSASPG